MASDNNNQATCTSEDAFAIIQVDAKIHKEEESRLIRLKQEDVNKDFNQGQMYKDTVTQNLPFLRR
jgi:hypothetical protein